MAISKSHYDILKELHARGVLPQGGALLEIGEANWYGDFCVDDIFHDAEERCDEDNGYHVAWLIYKAMFALSVRHAIDAGGPTARRLDLNQPIACEQQYDVVYNHGTAEHVFNIAQVFKTMHDACKVGGLLIHEAPFTGWVDHGFYNLQPTLFWDVAHANGYAIVFAATEHLASRTWDEIGSREDVLERKRRGTLADNLMLYVAMRKTKDEPFRTPMQGVYRGDMSESVNEAWRGLR